MDIDRITGMLTGVMLGDMLGSTVEGWSPQQVEEKHGRITGLLPGSCTTDDWQLTVAVSEALIQSGMDMDAQAAAHVAAMKESSSRWGRTTNVAVHSLAVGKHWSKSGQLLGIGNGVVMKLAPLAAILAATTADAERGKVEQFAIDLTRMTHRNRLAAAATLAHMNALAWCLRIKPGNFSRAAFITLVTAHAKSATILAPPDAVQFDDLVERLADLPSYARSNPDHISEGLRGDSYVRDSLPLSYAFFLRHPSSIKSMFETASAGEDADTNCSMVGALLGALNGTVVFPAALVEQVPAAQRAEVADLAERLTSRFMAG